MAAERIMAFIALRAPAEPDGDALAASVKARFADRLNIPVSAMPGQSGALLLDMGGTMVTVMTIDRPPPLDAYQRALQTNRRWPEAGTAMQAHQAHLIVATLSEVDGHAEALHGSVCVSLVAAALAEATPAEAVVWTSGDALTRAETFVSEIEGLVGGQTPVLPWISLDVYKGPDAPGGAATFTMYTNGLRVFVGRELEMAPTAAEPGDLAMRMIGTCQYLIVNGLVLADGDTLGVSEAERIRATYMDPGARVGIPAIRLTVERLDG